MDYRESLLYLDRFTNYEVSSHYNYRSAYSLEGIKRLLLLLDNPQDGYFSIIISGTKGKGSTACILSSILTKAGIKTARYSSPHLISVRERIRIGEETISRTEFSKTTSSVKKTIEKHKLKGLTYFEVLTAIAFLHFLKKRVDVAVLEVGLGGRLDATNVAPARISAITPISLDHTHLLGDSVETIASEKSAIIKDNSFTVSAPQLKVAEAVISSVAHRKKSKLFFVGKDITYKNLKVSSLGTSFDAKTPFLSYRNLRVALIGKHQAINTLTSLAIVEILNRYFHFFVKETDIRAALMHIKFPGRFQIISQRPYVILDGAQNKASAQSLRDTLKAVFGRSDIVLILGISSDKDIEGIGKVLCPLAEHLIFTKAASQRATPPSILARRLTGFCRSGYVTYDIEDAVAFSKEFAGKDDIIVITGSLFLVGDALKILGKQTLACSG